MSLRSIVALVTGALLAVAAAPAATAALDSRALDGIPMVSIDAESARRAVAAMPSRTAHGPQPIAAIVRTSAGLDDGAWTIEGGDAVWRLRLYSAGARLMIAHLDRLALPEGASLRFMSADGSVVQGPWTRRERRKHAAMWTPMVPGDAAMLELRTPAASRDTVRLHVSEIGHGIVAPFERPAIEPKSGGCNIDVACPQGDAWRSNIRAVVRLQIPAGVGFVSLCTGTLMNNTAQDGTPYVSTAHHCGVTSLNAGGVVAYYNYQTSTCGGTPDGSLSQTTSGASLRADHATSDHTLIELDDAPQASFGAYYAGFDASASDIPSSGASIHHPAGDEKRISLYTTAPTKQDTLLAGNTVRAFKVFWSQGVTEQGSSGSGLLNQDRQVVGVLSGGASSCANTDPRDNYDFYGRLEYAWTNGNVKAYLDKANTGLTRLCGTNAGSTCSGGGGDDDGGDGGGGGGGGAFGLGGLAVLLGAGLWRRRRMRVHR